MQARAEFSQNDQPGPRIMDGVTQHLRESKDKASTQSRAGFAVLELFRRKVWGVRWYRALGWGGLYSLMGLVLSFITIKFTAIFLGPSGIALVAPYSTLKLGILRTYVPPEPQ